MANRIEIGKIIREHRKRFGYTQQALSDLTNVHKSTISEIENGRFSGSFDIFERVMNGVQLQFEVSQKKPRFPDWEEIDALFSEDDA